MSGRGPAKLTSKENIELQTSLVFGLGGLISGLVSGYVFLHASTFAERQPAYHSPHLSVLYVFGLPGAIFLVALIGCFVLCHGEWLTVRARPWRCLIAAVLLSLNTLVATCAGLFLGLVTTGLMFSPPAGGAFGPFHPPQHLHPVLFFSFPVVIGLIVGTFVAAMSVALALYIFTEIWDPAALGALIFFAVAVLVVALAINPQFLPLFYRPQEASSTIFGRTFSTLLILGYTSYGACAGHWVAHSARRGIVG